MFKFCSIQMTLLTFVTSEACRAQTIDVRKFPMEQKMMTIFISFQQKENFWKSDQICSSYNVVSRSGPPRPPLAPKRYSKTSHQIGLRMAQPCYQMLYIRCSISRLSHTKQRQRSILGPLELTNLFGPSNKVVYLKKLVFQSAIRFLIRFIFEHAQRPLVDFWKKWPAHLNFIWLEEFGIQPRMYFKRF